MGRIVVRSRKTGAEICEVKTLYEGYDLIAEYEAADVEEGIYEPDFYECVVEQQGE